jgi:hypothetical protein
MYLILRLCIGVLRLQRYKDLRDIKWRLAVTQIMFLFLFPDLTNPCISCSTCCLGACESSENSRAVSVLYLVNKFLSVSISFPESLLIETADEISLPDDRELRSACQKFK